MGDCWGLVLYIEVYKSRYHNNWTWGSSPRSGAAVILSVRALRISDRRKDGATTVTKKHYRPKLFHKASMRFFVAASIRISSGHGRANPSAAHFRVASTPIVDPKS